MFSTILKEVTGYFDRHALISAFFPSLVFWGGTLCLSMRQTLGWQASLESWDQLSSTGQFLILFAFFVWIAFWSFLTINFQPSLLRLYEGYWPEDSRLIGRLWQYQSQIYKQRWDESQSTDKKLEKAQTAIIQQHEQIQALIQQIPTLKQTNSSTSPPPLENLAKAINAYLNQFQNSQDMTHLASEDITADLETLSQQWSNWASGCHLLQTERQNKEWKKIEQRLTEITLDFDRWITLKLGIVEEKRHQHNRTQFLFWPPQRDDVLPTQLGNILKAAELYSQQRYNLDAVVIWSRLQNALPEKFAKILQSAKISLDLMVTLSAFCLIFGIPLSIGLSIRAASFFITVVPLGLTIAAFLMQQFWIGCCALIATVLAEILFRFPDSQIAPLIRLQVFLTLISAVLWVSRLSYQNATQAALTYGEQIKAAFDLYRWKALEALNLKLPTNLSEERQLWDEVSKFLYRGYSDQLGHYQYQLPEKTYHLEHPSQTKRVVVARQVLRAYEIIDPDKLEYASLPIAEVPQDAISNIEDVNQCCPVTPLQTDAPLCVHHLVDHALIDQHFIVGIPATPSMTMNGTLQTGNAEFD